MKITPKILSIPPFISTSWENVLSIHVQTNDTNPTVIISLQDGSKIQVPNLTQLEIDEIFYAHVNSSETKTQDNAIKHESISFAIPVPSDISPEEMISSNLQHNPEQSHLPPIPPHILEKIATLIKTLNLEENPFSEEPSFNCNCIYCQLAKTIHSEDSEEIIDDADLTFRDWEISQKEDKLYHVVNPIDKNEYYDVFLGNPIGCTCGCKNCEHIKAVLNS